MIEFVNQLEESKPIKIVYENEVKTEVDNDGNITITKKITPYEIAELFDVPISDVINNNLKFGIITLPK